MLNTKLQSEEYRFYFLFFLALMFFFSMLAPISYGDLGVWIAEGRQIFQQGTVYIKDAYSFNVTQTHPYPWLSAAIYHLLDSNFSIDLIFVLHRLIPVFIIGFWLTRYPVLMSAKNLLCLLLCFRGVGMLIIDRPALLVLPLIPIFYELIDSEKIYAKKVKTLFLLVLWTNLHGSFALFFLLLGYKTFIQFLRSRKQALSKERIFFFASAFLATLINPWGFKIYNYVFQTAAVSKVRMGEWQPLALFEQGQISADFLYFVISVLILCFLVYKKGKFRAFFFSPLPVLILSSFLAIRNLPLFFTVFPLFWGKHLADQLSVKSFPPKPTFTRFILHRVVISIFIVLGIYMFTGHSEEIRAGLPKNAQRYDETSVFRIGEYLSHSKGKRIFNDWILGSFFMYKQDNQIFIDTRNIIYDNLVYTDYLKIVLNQNAQAESLLNHYKIDYIVIDKTKPLAAMLRSSNAWTFITEDNGYSLFEKN